MTLSLGEMGSGWSARSRTVSVVFGNWGRVELMTVVTQEETEGPTRGERVEQMMRAILIWGGAICSGDSYWKRIGLRN